MSAEGEGGVSMVRDWPEVEIGQWRENVGRMERRGLDLEREERAMRVVEWRRGRSVCVSHFVLYLFNFFVNPFTPASDVSY